MLENKINRVLFLGSKSLGLRVLNEIYVISPKTLMGVLTINDTNDTRNVFDGFQKFANNNAVDLHIADDRKQSEQIIDKLKPDLCIVVNWYWMISDDLLDNVSNGFIGIHNSLLPKFRGGSPLIWAIINEEVEVGFSFFSFTPGMDDGPIWAQEKILVEEHDYISDIEKKLEVKCIEVLREKYAKILDGLISPVQQNHEISTYCAQRFPKDGKVDWNKKAKYVFNCIRAQSDPYPGAFTYFNGRKLKIWKAKLLNKTYYGTPGQVARLTSDGAYIICGDNRVIILEDVEFNGERVKACDLIKSIKVRMSNIAE